ncbi:MAG: c-type cytochrome [Aquabacterium sp.]|nr:c-type cytochrome [Aquabacterium sp.]
MPTKRRAASLLSVLGLLQPALSHAQARLAGDAAIGQRLYQTYCTRCHAVDENKIGPAHRGVYGRLAGSGPGYEYSTGLSYADFVWNERTLDLWLKDPSAMVPWQQMDFQVPDPRERAHLIAYLKTLK